MLYFTAIDETKSTIVKVDISSLETNILMIHLDITKVTAIQFLERLHEVRETDSVKVRIKAGTRDDACVRFVTYWEITDEDVKLTINKLQMVIEELETKTKYLIAEESV